MDTKRIDILMATYNGGAFLSQQLRSLQSQTFENWELWIHDDGSSDQTLDIIAEFVKQDSRIHWINDDIKYKNPAYNFLSLLPFSQAPFCIFCDQDDIWLENKLSVLYEAIKELDPSQPAAVYSNSFIYEPEKAQISGFATLATPKNLYDLLFLNAGVQGCAILFNAALRSICKDRPEFVCMHDHLLTLAAITFGQLIYVDKRLMLYRRYEGTVTGYTDKGFASRWKKFFQKGKTVIHPDHYTAILSFYNHYKTRISPDKRKIFQAFFSFKKRTRIANAMAVWKYGFNLYGKKSILMFKLLVRPL